MDRPSAASLATRSARLWLELEDDVDRGLGDLSEPAAVREAFFPTASMRYAVEPARSADEARITAIARAHQPAGAVTVMRSWWDAMPSAFRVVRDSDGSPAAFQCLCQATSVPAWLLAADPVAATWREHLRANPVPRGQQVLCLRHMLARTAPGSTRPNRRKPPLSKSQPTAPRSG